MWNKQLLSITVAQVTCDTSANNSQKCKHSLLQSLYFLKSFPEDA